ncbi:MAG: hypothetical protein CK532_03735 [Flavobacteriales bacterium]|nr:MAG: hypothetical protein CK532_03735 [Flavobacteriales bacterium]
MLLSQWKKMILSIFIHRGAFSQSDVVCLVSVVRTWTAVFTNSSWPHINPHYWFGIPPQGLWEFLGN